MSTVFVPSFVAQSLSGTTTGVLLVSDVQTQKHSETKTHSSLPVVYISNKIARAHQVRFSLRLATPRERGPTNYTEQEY